MIIVSLQTHRLQTLEQVRRFVVGNAAVDLRHTDRESAYGFIRRTLVWFGYVSLSKPEKGLIRSYLLKTTGYSRAQLDRLIRQYRDSGEIRDRCRGGPAQPFKRRYTKADIGLLWEVDETLGRMSGPATSAVMRRELERFGDQRFERLAYISNGHLYNLRKSKTYGRRRTTLTKTISRSIPIGERHQPWPRGRPGFLRVDTVHQGDRDGENGVYYINVVDEVTQWQHVGTVRAISEHFLQPVLEALISGYPFVVHGFHTDNGSEYINHRTVRLLAKLRVGEFTKSRPRHSNDNALVETKNGAVIRSQLGYNHIPAHFAPVVNDFTQKVLTPFLNFHRPCLFPIEVTDDKGRIRKRYRHQDVTTPYEKLKSLPRAEQCLKPGVTFEQLDAIAYAHSDLAAARALNEARRTLFDKVQKHLAARRPRTA